MRRDIWGVMAWLATGAAGCVALTGCETTQRAPGGGPTTPGGTTGERPTVIKYDETKRKPQVRLNPDKIAPADDIVDIVQYWSNVPWLRDLGRTVGFQVPTYFVSAKSQAGAFVPGRITVSMQRLQNSADGQRVREPLYRWDLDEDKANPFRVVKKAAGGYYYGFVLTWPEDVRIDGQEIEIQFTYERADGRVVKGNPREFKVPGNTVQPVRRSARAAGAP